MVIIMISSIFTLIDTNDKFINIKSAMKNIIFLLTNFLNASDVIRNANLG